MDLAKIRKEQNITQQQLANEFNVSRQLISLYETKKRTPPVPMAKKLGKYFGVPWGLFFEDDNEPPTK